MILKKIKGRSIDKIINKQLKQISVPADSGKKIARIGFIINYENGSNLADFYRFAKKLNVKDTDVKFAGYIQKREKGQEYPIPVFSNNSIDWNGQMKERDVVDFMNSGYDLLINYYRVSEISLQLVSALTKADFRAGMGQENEPLNHLLVEVAGNNFESFTDEVVKYLTILNKI